MRGADEYWRVCDFNVKKYLSTYGLEILFYKMKRGEEAYDRYLGFLGGPT